MGFRKTCEKNNPNMDFLNLQILFDRAAVKSPVDLWDPSSVGWAEYPLANPQLLGYETLRDRMAMLVEVIGFEKWH